MKKLNLLLLGIILLIAIFFRFYNLASNPPSLTWDEAAWGYNAYALGIDGKDEFGRFLPITYLESFGDYKPPVYAYLSVIPVKVLGLNEFSTRFASAFFGVLTVALTFFLTKQILKTPGTKNEEPGSNTIALLAAGVLAISPWHVLLSRAAFEANVATFFLVFGVYLFLMAKSRPVLIIVSVISFILSMYTFNSARIVAPFLLIGLVIAYRTIILRNMKKEFIISVIVGGIMFLPLFFFLLTPEARLRFAEVNIFSEPKVVEDSNQYIENDNNAWWSNIIHNRRVGYSLSYVNHYFDNFSPNFLFIKGDGNPKFSTQDVGQLYIFEIPFFIAGILFLIRKRRGAWWIIPFWIIVGIIPAATARETPHALRIETIIPTFQILTALGLYYLGSALLSLKTKILGFKLAKILLVVITVGIFANVVYFLHGYFVHYPRIYSGEWQYGYREAVKFANNNEAKFDSIIFTEELGRPYIYALFYGKVDPDKFRSTIQKVKDGAGFTHIAGFGKYKFSKSVRHARVRGKNRLYVDTPGIIPKYANKLSDVKRLNGETVFVIYEL